MACGVSGGEAVHCVHVRCGAALAVEPGGAGVGAGAGAGADACGQEVLLVTTHVTNNWPNTTFCICLLTNTNLV